MPAADLEFERSFSDLAFAALQNKTPTLLDSVVGFQVLDVNEDQTHSIGVFGLRAGHDWIFVPIFYMKGEIKSDHLYMREQNMLCPLKENWVNYILSRKPYVLGEASDMSRRDIFRSAPDFTSFIYSPSLYGKSSSSQSGWSSANIQPWAEPAREFFNSMRLQTLLPNATPPTGNTLLSKLAAAVNAARPEYPQLLARMDVGTFIRTEGPVVVKAAADTMRTREKFAQSLLSYYKPADILVNSFGFGALANSRKYAKSANDKGEACEFKPSDPKSDTTELPWHSGDNKVDVEVITPEDLSKGDTKSTWLTDSEKEELLKGKIHIKDLRSGTAHVYNAEVDKAFSNPTETGVYKMFVSDGTFEDVLILAAPKTIGTGTANCLTAVHLGSKAAVNAAAKSLLIKPTGISPLDWMRFFGKQTNAESAKVGSSYVLLTAGMQGSLPFKVVKKKENADGTTELSVDVHDYVDYRFREPYGRNNCLSDIKHNRPARELKSDKGDMSCCRVRKIVIAPRPMGLQNIGETLFAGSDAKVMSADFDSKDFPSCGTIEDAENLLIGSGAVLPLKIYGHGYSEYSISSGNKKEARHLSYKSAALSLVREYGIHAKTASELLRKAETGKAVNVFVGVKKAAPSGNLGEGPTAPAIPDSRMTTDRSGYPASGPQTELMAVPDTITPQGNKQLYDPNPQFDNPQNGVGGTSSNNGQVAEQAAQTGQKDIFDVGALASLVATVDSGALIDKYMSDLFLALDRVGRILFLYYQHATSFIDRYGDDDMEELEDSLRNVFDGLGELIMFLKQRTIEPAGGSTRSQVDLGDVAN